MKKRISTILAVVLTIALLASSFVMLGVHAEDPATETLTIGLTDYEIYTDKKYAAYDSMAAAVEGLTPTTSNFKDSNVVVSFENTAWSAEGRYPWKPDLAVPKYIQTDSKYTQISLYPSNAGFGQHSVSLYKGGLHVSPSNSWLGENEIYSISLKYKVKEAGNIVIYDTVGTVSASSAANAEPFWDWLPGNVGKDWMTFSIYKNDTLLWPKKGEDNKFEAGGEMIEFPDLGVIAVDANDVISVKVEGYSTRGGIDINPAVAYAKVNSTTGGSEPVETEEITIGETTYTIEKNGKYNAYDTLKTAVDGLDATKFTAVDLSNSVWQTKISKWNNSYISPIYYGPANYSSYPAFMTGDKIDWRTEQNTSTVILDTNEYLAVTPFVKDDNTACAFIDLEFKAPKTGKVLIYDVLGAVKAPTANNQSPYWAWLKNHVNKVEVTVLKSGTQIWPTDDTTDNLITDIGDSVAIPDLGEIEVVKGETITLRIQEINNIVAADEQLPSRDVVFTDIEVAYVYDPSAAGGDDGDSADSAKETITVGTNTYEVLKDANYDLYSGFTALTSGLADKSTVDFKGNWSMAYRYTNDVDFGINPWKSELSYKYGIPYYSVAYKGAGDVTYKGIYPDSYLSINTYHNCFFTSSVTLIPENECVYISPNSDNLKENQIDESKWGPTLKVTFKSNKTGKAVLYDTTGAFNGDVAKTPFWANEGTNAKTRVEIYKNNTKIWPTDSDVVISNTNKFVAFPDLGELDVKIGDEIKFIFYANPESPATRTGVLCNPAIAFTEVTATGVSQTDANFGTEVMVLVSVIAVLGAVVIAAGVISKKRVHN